MPSSQTFRKDLFNRLLESRLTQQDIDALVEWLGNDDLDPEAAGLIMEQLRKPVASGYLDAEVLVSLESRLQQILQQDAQKETAEKRLRRMPAGWLRYAAVFLIMAGAGLYFLFFGKAGTKKTDNVEFATYQSPDIEPGKKGAILTLKDGSRVVLDNKENGFITAQPGAKIILNNGQLRYAVEKTAGKEEISYNTMSTPKGRQFQLLLPDGSKVWLNAASSIRFPTVFHGKERVVEISGELYFEIARNEKMPFRVKVNEETEIEVLGTHFNINSYSNESTINTSLLEGSVRIINKGETVILKPGQQAQVAGFRNTAGGRGIRVLNNVNMEKVMAWKNGIFNFEDASLEEVMRQLERWYDIEVRYEKGVPKLEFFGKMDRSLTLANVLRGLEVSKVHFRIEQDRKLVVLP